MASVPDGNHHYDCHGDDCRDDVAVLENGVPFELKDTPKMSVKGLEIMTAINDKAINDGVAGMTEEEIETEIAAARAKK